MTTINDESEKTEPARPEVEINWLNKLFTLAIAIAVLTATGPFGTYDEMALPMRTAYWSIAAIGVGVIMNSIAYFSLFLPQIVSLAWPVRMLLWVLVGSVPGAVYMMLVGYFFFGPHVLDGSWLRLYYKLCMISSVICLIDLRGFAFAKLTEDTENTEDTEVVEVSDTYQAPAYLKFIQGLRSDLGNDIISLTTQDHYLEVTTALGQDLVLGKMADAANQLAGLPGLRLHRSHFAALKHIQRLRRRGSGYIVILSDGRELPVSRTYLPRVRKALGV